MQQHSDVSDVLNPRSVIQQPKTAITFLSTSQSRLFPRGGKAFIHPPWHCWPSCWPCEHPFQAQGERGHPSAGLLRIFMTGCLVPQRLLTGRAPAGESETGQNTNDTPSVLVRGYTSETKRRRGCRSHPDAESEADVY